MSSRLPTRSLSRSASSSMVSRNSWVAAGVEVDVALQQARDRRLDRRQRRAQVVRHGREQRGAQLVGLGQPGGPVGVGPQLALLRPRSPPAPANALEHLAVVVAEGPAPAGPARRRRASGTADVGVVGSLDGDVARTSPATCQSSPPACAEHGDAVGLERERAAGRPAAAAGPPRRQRAAQRGERLRLGARLRRLGRAPRRGRDEQAHHARDHEEDHEREEVLALGDRERVVRAA